MWNFEGEFYDALLAANRLRYSLMPYIYSLDSVTYSDAEGTQVISEEITMTLRDRVPTGDPSNLPLYLIVAAVAMILLIALRRRGEAE